MPPLVISSGAQVSVIQPDPQVKLVEPGTRILGVVAVPAGSTFSESAFEYVQVTPASTWIITMPVGWPARRPDVTLWDSSNIEVESDVVWSPSTKVITVTFPSPTSGVALIT